MVVGSTTGGTTPSACYGLPWCLRVRMGRAAMFVQVGGTPGGRRAETPRASLRTKFFNILHGGSVIYGRWVSGWYLHGFTVLFQARWSLNCCILYLYALFNICRLR